MDPPLSISSGTGRVCPDLFKPVVNASFPESPVPTDFLGRDFSFPNELVERRLRYLKVGGQLFDSQDIGYFFFHAVHLSDLKVNFEPECLSLSLIFIVIASSCQVFLISSQLKFSIGDYCSRMQIATYFVAFCIHSLVQA